MIFHPHLAAQVLSGEKTVTRRQVRYDDYGFLKPCRYVEGRDYAVQDRRGGKALGRIRVLSAYRDPLGRVIADETNAEARAEGFATGRQFFDYWRSLYGEFDPGLLVWRVEFKLAERAER